MADKSGKTIDPFDVEALEKSLNDSATRVSTIWASYLLFGLYLVLAAGNVTHRQLFLAEPIKLPVLNIDLPLLGFFFLAPLLFVILHAYVLIQVLLLARTAAAYDDAVDGTIANDSYRAKVRQRLVNTLFAQIFSGSPGEREGFFGWVLRLMAWTTLAFAPVAVLLLFTIKFLPYQSHALTWTHRLLIAFDLFIVLLLWLWALDARQESIWRSLQKKWRISLAGLLFVFLTWTLPTFPGEIHAGLTRYTASKGTDLGEDGFAGLRSSLPFFGQPEICSRRSILTNFLSPAFDRLSLPREDFVDFDKLAKIEARLKAEGKAPFRGASIHNLHRRNLVCSNFLGANLRRVAFGEARLSGAIFDMADLQGSSFAGAKLHGASFAATRLQGADLGSAELHGAMLYGAYLQGASLDRAKLQGAVLGLAHLQGATLDRAQVQAAILDEARLQGSSLKAAQLEGASFHTSQMQGATLADTNLTLTYFVNTLLWNTDSSKCDRALVVRPRFDAFIWIDTESDRIDNSAMAANPEEIERFIESVVASVPGGEQDRIRRTLRSRLVAGVTEASAREKADVWRACARPRVSEREYNEYQEKLGALLRDVACAAGSSQEYLAWAIYRNWIQHKSESLVSRYVLARGLLGLDGKPCPGASDLAAEIKEKLKGIVAAPPIN